jgi:ABC-type uncharacterized transport system permease subunit
VKSGRRRVSLAWIGVVPFFAYTLVFLFLPAATVMVGAFQGATGGYTFHNVTGIAQTADLRHAYKESIEISLVTALLGGLLGFLIAYAAIRDGTPNWIRSAFATFSGVALPPSTGCARSGARRRRTSARTASSSGATSACRCSSLHCSAP